MPEIEQQDVTLNLGLTLAQYEQLIAQAAEKSGLAFTFQPGSNPNFHFHIHLREGTSMSNGTEYSDKSSGPTGAKAFGRHAAATQHGPVVQQKASPTPNAAEAISMLEQVRALLSQIQVVDRTRIDNAVRDVEAARDAAKSDSSLDSARGHWQKAKSYIEGAMQFGLFSMTVAEQLKTIVERISSFFS